jgi:hypothetical protein
MMQPDVTVSVCHTVTLGVTSNLTIFVTYPIAGLGNLAPDGIVIPFADGHQRQLPVLTGGPFRYQVHADTYLKAALGHAKAAVKQAVIAPSALSLLYPPADLDGYPREAFLRDLINEAETDIRGTLETGAHVAQLDFTEGRLSLKLDPSGGVLDNLIALNNQVLERFSDSERRRIGVHTCPGGDQDSTHSLDIGYAGLLPKLFQLKAGNFYIQLASEADQEKVLAIVAEYLPADARIFIGVTDPIDPRDRPRSWSATGSWPPPGSCRPSGSAPATTAASRPSPTTPPPLAISRSPRSERVSRGRLSRPSSWDCDSPRPGLAALVARNVRHEIDRDRPEPLTCSTEWVRPSSSASRSGKASRAGRSVRLLGRKVIAPRVARTWPPPPTSRCRRVQGSGSSVSATATACRNHRPSGTLGSQYGCVRCEVTSNKAADCGRRCKIRVSKIPTNTRAPAYPSGSWTVPIAAPSGTGECGGRPHALTPSWCDASLCEAARNRLGEMPTLSVKWLVNEPRLL